MQKIQTRKLVESAMLIAVGTVLSLIKFDMPMGGGVTLVSMLPLIILSHRYGWKWGTVSAFVYSLLQLVLGLLWKRLCGMFQAPEPDVVHTRLMLDY